MDYLSLLYQGKSGGNLYSAYFDGTTWCGNKIIGSMNSNPGVICFEKNIHVIFVDDCCNLCESVYQGGGNWTPKVQLAGSARSNPDHGDSGPNVVLFGNGLFTAYKGYHPNLRFAYFNHGEWLGDRTFTTSTGVTPESNMDPAIVEFQNKLYVFYKDKSSNIIHWIWHEANVNNIETTNWSVGPEIMIDGTNGLENLESDRAPAAVVYDDKLYLFYKIADSGLIYYSIYDGIEWRDGTNSLLITGEKELDKPTDDSPSAIVYNDLLYVFFCSESNKYIYFSVFDKEFWSEPKAITIDQEKIQSPNAPGVMVASIVPVARSSWMLTIPDDTLISNINLLGTHDSAAYNSFFSHTFYACQSCSITDQLEYGVRVLDVRLAERDEDGTIVFYTCHGSFGFGDDAHLYQTFYSLLNECQAFLTARPSECIVMMLKFDDPNDLRVLDVEKRHQIELALTQLLSKYKSPDKSNLFAMQSDIPKLKDVRGKIYLYNRIIQTPPADIQLGTYVHWTDNTQGTIAQCVQDVYVQDWYKVGLYGGTIPKLTAIEQAFLMKKTSNIVLNFASAIDSANLEIMNNGNLLNFFGEKPASERLTQLGWTMFDFPFTPYYTSRYSWLRIADIIIQSNFGYMGYEDKFSVLYSGHPDL